MAWLRPAAALDSPVYRYLVTHKPSGPVNATSDLLPFASRFSFHSLDVVSFFGGMEVVLGKPLSDADDKFQRLITQHLVTFATTGELTSCLNPPPPPNVNPRSGGGASFGCVALFDLFFLATLPNCLGPCRSPPRRVTKAPPLFV